VAEAVEALSLLESNIDPPLSGSVKVSLAAGGQELFLSNGLLFRSDEDVASCKC